MGPNGIPKRLLSLPQFLVNGRQIKKGGQILVKGPEARHIVGSRRLKKGDELRLCDGEGNFLFGRIIDVKNEGVLVDSFLGPLFFDDRKDLIFILSIIKSERFDIAISKLSEIGVRAIIPVFTERTLLRDRNEKRLLSKHKRWKRLSLEALKQSKGFFATAIHFPCPLKEALKGIPVDSIRIVVHEKEEGGILENIKGVKKGPLFIAIGPEGGFSEGDLELFKHYGFLRTGLSSRVLRSETAAIYVASFFSEYLNGA